MNSITRPDAVGPTPEILTRHQVATREPARYDPIGTPVSRVIGVHERLIKARKISPAHGAWADRYVLESEILSGARAPKPEQERVDADYSPPIYNRQVAASQWLRGAWSRMTKYERMIFEGACVSAYRIGDCAVMMGILPKDDETMEAFEDRTRARVYKKVREIIAIGSGIPIDG